MQPENQLALIPPAGLFQHIAPILVGKKDVVMLIVTKEGDKLRVNLTEKIEDTEGDALPLSLSVVASAQELDAEFPAEITKMRSKLESPGTITEQVDAQVQTAAAGAEGTDKKKKKTTSASKPAAIAKKKIVKPTPVPRKTPVKAAVQKTAAKKPASAPRTKFTRDQMLSAYAQLKAKHGDDLTMEIYVNSAKCDGADVGRSFERTFGGWKKFAKAGEKRIAAAQPAAQSKPAAPLAAARSAANAGPAKLPDGWPFPPSERAVYLNDKVVYTMPATDPVVVGQVFDAPGAGKVRATEVTPMTITVIAETPPAPPAPVIRTVYDTEGTLIGTTALEPTVNETIELADLAPMKVLAVGKTRITVEATTESAGA